jgi:hypothetical protein
MLLDVVIVFAMALGLAVGLFVGITLAFALSGDLLTPRAVLTYMRAWLSSGGK